VTDRIEVIVRADEPCSWCGAVVGKGMSARCFDLAVQKKADWRMLCSDCADTYEVQLALEGSEGVSWDRDV
jgi:hypothetical protein